MLIDSMKLNKKIGLHEHEVPRFYLSIFFTFWRRVVSIRQWTWADIDMFIFSFVPWFLLWLACRGVHVCVWVFYWVCAFKRTIPVRLVSSMTSNLSEMRHWSSDRLLHFHFAVCLLSLLALNALNDTGYLSDTCGNRLENHAHKMFLK